ncbi:hypothetical protein SLS62_001339 [Diatrype stigma]|uniref:Bifunctional lycopene cyclase/phytoene synthase n=1 Tax=Diatrype stigma TaxID=117547 RepID=A0AAN9V1S9_9PEZI
MGWDYALVHIKFTIPLAGLLTAVLKPLLTRTDLYKTSALIVIAFTSALPWDSYLVHQRIWTYPEDAILGPRFLKVPVEELFFFVIQTYITSMFYILLNKPSFHPQYLTNRADSAPGVQFVRRLGQSALTVLIAYGFYLVRKGGEGTYLGLILAWACPFALLTWTFSGLFLLRLPAARIALPILIPTVYLWLVDELALGRGTWAIESGTKLGICIFGSLEIEEAVFFLATNVLVVLGLVAFDRGTAVVNTFPGLFPEVPATPTFSLVLKGVFTNPSKYDIARVRGLRDSVKRLKSKSRSFYLASSTFPGRLRIDLVLLYSFCRVADDLVDEARTQAAALDWIDKLTKYLDLAYASDAKASASTHSLAGYIDKNFPESARSALKLLPTSLLPKEPLYELLEGFKMDLSFTQGDGRKSSPQFPIKDEQTLELYAHRVASTVGELCLWLVFHHSQTRLAPDQQAVLVAAARTMGHALQYVNIARDIKVDAAMNRVYLPTSWLKEEGPGQGPDQGGLRLTPEDIIRNPDQAGAETLRQRLLDLAFREYGRSRPVMGSIPDGDGVRGPLIVAVESYMEIGRVLRERAGVPCPKNPDRATVPRSRRIWVAWKNLALA